MALTEQSPDRNNLGRPLPAIVAERDRKGSVAVKIGVVDHAFVKYR